MGLKDYFHPVDKNAVLGKPAPTAGAAQRSIFPDISNMFPKKPQLEKQSAAFDLSTIDGSNIPTLPLSLNARPHRTSSNGPAFPEGDFRNGTAMQLMDIKADVMVNWLHHQQQERTWTNYGWDEGVVLKKARGDYVCCPSDMLQHQDGFYDSVKKLNVKVSFRLTHSNQI